MMAPNILCMLLCKASACNAGGLGSSLGWEGPLENEMATHSSILAWRIPWIEKPGRLSISWDRKSQTRLSTIFLSFPKVKSRFVQFPVGLPTLFM